MTNWYVICTQNNKESKVVAALNKKGIENFCPFTIAERKNVSRTYTEFAPLFNSYIFVNITAAQLAVVKNIPYVVSTLFWKNQPAVISKEEINAIKTMCSNYSTVKAEKTAVTTTQTMSVVEKSTTTFNTRTVSVQHQGISVSLPSLGFVLSADRANAISTITTAGRRSFAQRINVLSFLGINL